MPSPDHGDFVWINGRVTRAEDAAVSVFDRGFLYGDSLFESVLVRNGRPFRWQAHRARMAAGAGLLRMPPPAGPMLDDALDALLRANAAGSGSVRITLSRGPGRRGYSPRNAGPPTLVLAWHPAVPAPERGPWQLATSPYRVLAGDPLAACKHGSRLANVLSRAAAEEAGADEALLLDSGGHIAETSSGNLFCIRGTGLFTPPVSGLLPGVTRGCVLEIAAPLGWEVHEQVLTPADLVAADAVFFTTSSLGVVPVGSLDGTAVGNPAVCRPIAAALDALVDRECAEAPMA